MVNFGEWKKSTLAWVGDLIRLVLSKCKEFYLLSIFLLNMFDMTDLNVFLLFCTLLMSIFYYKESLNKKYIINTSPEKINSITNLLILTIFLLNFFFNMIFIIVIISKLLFLGNLAKFVVPYVTFETGMKSFGLAAILTLFLRDLMTSKMYQKEKTSMLSSSLLKAELVGMCQAYDLNEEKIYTRVKTMCKMDRLAEIENSVWSLESEIKNLKFDCKYWHRELEMSVETSINKLQELYLSKPQILKFRVTQAILSFLYSNTSSYLFEDTICAMLRVFEKNSFLLGGKTLDIKDYYSGGIDIY